MKVYTVDGRLESPFAIVYYNGQGDLCAGPYVRDGWFKTVEELRRAWNAIPADCGRDHGDGWGGCCHENEHPPFAVTGEWWDAVCYGEGQEWEEVSVEV